jgi:hypothetical protein
MKQMISGISTIPYNQKFAVDAAFRNSKRQTTNQAAPSTALAGVPGEPDHRKFLTGALQNMIPVHTGNTEGVVGTLAYSTNNKQWRDYDPGRLDGLYAPAGEYLYAKRATISYKGNPDPLGPPTIRYTITNTPEAVVPPTRAVVTNPAKAGVFSVKVVQEADPF